MRYQLEKKSLKIGNIEKEIMYSIIKDLPTGKRSYTDIGNIYVRGLFYGEVVELSKIQEETIEDTLKVYRDAIKFENENYQLEDLELVDYILLTSIVNIMTTPDFKWYPNFKCQNIIPNPKIKKIENEIEDLEFKLENLNKAIQKAKKSNDIDNLKKFEKDKSIIQEEISKLKKEKDKILQEEPEVVCNHIVSTPVTIDDFEIDIKDPNVEVPYYYNFSGVEIELKPLTIRDIIELNNPSEIELIAKHIKNIPFDEALELIKISMPYEVEELKEIINRFVIELKPIKTKCQYCGKEYDLYVELSDIKVLPSF